MEASLVSSKWDIEYALTLSLAHIGLLVAIGDKHHSLRAAKFIDTDAEWRNRFAALCTNAKAIFILPGTSSSVIWEIDQIYKANNLSTKSFFIMPPERSSFLLNPVRKLFRSHNRRYWDNISLTLKRSGVLLPEYSSDGGIFALSPSDHGHVQFSVDAIRE
jgi:hypothetical protein